jgi:hypothetical protein
MLVKELIEKLKSLPENSQVVIEYTDLTDYHYITPLSDNDVNFCKEISSDIFDINDDILNEYGEIKSEFENVVVITFSES